MTKKKAVPAIRFKGFTDTWEQRKVGELSKRVIVGLATSVTPYYRDEGIPILRNLNIKENYLDDMDILYLEKTYAESQITKQIHTGDVLTVHTGYIGTSCIVPEKYDNCLTFTTLITTADEHSLNGEFLAQYLNSDIGMSAVQAVTTQGGRQNLNTNDFIKVEIKYPSLPEQEKICETLRNLDRLITLHQRKLDKLHNVKKSLLEKMFPRNGADVPEIRFKGFTYAWEQCELGSIYELNNERNGNQFPFERTISIATMTFNAAGNGADMSSLPNYKVLRIGDIAFEGHTNKEFRYGRFVLNDLGNGIMSPRFTTLRPIVQQCFLFWKYYIHSERVMRGKLINSTKAGTMMNELVVDDFLNQSILVPTLDEQEKIGKLLTALDKAITLHQRKLEKLRQIKKSLLEKMFV